MKRHQPRHLYLDNQIYFLTSHTYRDRFCLVDTEKSLLLATIKKVFKEYGFQIYGWVILPNHYHLLFNVSRAASLGRVIGAIHGGFTYKINRQESLRGRKIWQNYWDWCIRDEEGFYKHLNYIHHNPVKHGLATDMSEYEFSSFNSWVKKEGSEWVMSLFEQYPIKDFTVKND